MADTGIVYLCGWAERERGEKSHYLKDRKNLKQEEQIQMPTGSLT